MHYLTYVLLDEPGPVEQQVAFLLAGSARDPDRRYGEFATPCSCMGERAWTSAWQQVDASSRGIELMAQLAMARKAGDQERERSLLAERYRVVWALAIQDLRFGQPYPECDSCAGSGSFMQSRDLAQHLDWWTIGGRWDRLLARPETVFDAADTLGGNIGAFEFALHRATPAVVVTACGDWHEAPWQHTPAFLDQPAELERAAAEAQPWLDELQALLAAHPGCLAVVVDCHC